MEEKYLTISALNRYIKYKFEYDKNLDDILVSAEISNFKYHSSGHLYFKLKDETSEMKAMMFSSYANKLNFLPKDGDKVIVRGSIKAFERNGEYEFYVTEMSLSGIGELYLKFDKLKKELQAKGLFDETHKKSIPKFPKTVGILTSDTGAAIHDIITTIKRRFPLITLILYPTLVQGENAKNSIIKNIKKANSDALCDVLILGRGGGSLEDLWPFNEEEVAYAIYDSNIPIISAVGHEVDFSISDFVSDMRAATPTAAAELVSPNIVELKTNIKDSIKRINTAINKIISDKELILSNFDERLLSLSPKEKLNQKQNDLNKFFTSLNNNFSNLLNHSEINLTNTKEKLDIFITRYFENKSQEFKNINNRLDLLSPLKIMDKGFSIVENDNKIVRSVTDVKKNDNINIKVLDGTIEAKVVEVFKDGK